MKLRSYLFDNLYSKSSSCQCRDESQCCQNGSVLIIKWLAKCLCCSICYSSRGIRNRFKSSFSTLMKKSSQFRVSVKIVRVPLLLLKSIWALLHAVGYLMAQSSPLSNFQVKNFRKSVYYFLWIFHNIFSVTTDLIFGSFILCWWYLFKSVICSNSDLTRFSNSSCNLWVSTDGPSEMVKNLNLMVFCSWWFFDL